MQTSLPSKTGAGTRETPNVSGSKGGLETQWLPFSFPVFCSPPLFFGVSPTHFFFNSNLVPMQNPNSAQSATPTSQKSKNTPPSFAPPLSVPVTQNSPPDTLIPRPLQPLVFEQFPAAEKLPQRVQLGLTGARAADGRVPPRAARPRRRRRARGHGADVERESVRLHDSVKLGIYFARAREEVSGRWWWKGESGWGGKGKWEGEIARKDNWEVEI